MPKDKKLYLPVLVGASKNFRNGIKYQRDDDGDNISFKNPNYNELTAVYWAWKNLKNVDAVGLVHYRRIFKEKRFVGRKLGNVLKKETVEKKFEKCDVLLPRKRRYYIETNFSHYVHAHHKEPLVMARSVINDIYPEYLDAFDLVMNRKSAHMFNMFVMKRLSFEKYSKWLFDVLFELEKRIDIESYSVQEARVFGYVSELLMDVWIEKNQVVYSEIDWIQLGNRQLLKKMYFFLVRKFAKNDQKKHSTHF